MRLIVMSCTFSYENWSELSRSIMTRLSWIPCSCPHWVFLYLLQTCHSILPTSSSKPPPSLRLSLLSPLNKADDDGYDDDGDEDDFLNYKVNNDDGNDDNAVKKNVITWRWCENGSVDKHPIRPPGRQPYWIFMFMIFSLVSLTWFLQTLQVSLSRTLPDLPHWLSCKRQYNCLLCKCVITVIIIISNTAMLIFSLSKKELPDENV